MTRELEGPLDLSERYAMDFAEWEDEQRGLADWRTDAIYLFNLNGSRSLLNRAYPYTKGWYAPAVPGVRDPLVASAEGAPGAEYGTRFNWIHQAPPAAGGEGAGGPVALRPYERDVLFADPEGSQWNVGVAPADIVERVRKALRTRKAPVLVIYNQNRYWHAVYVIGYDDAMDNGGCSYTEGFRRTIVATIDGFERKADLATDPAEKAFNQRQARLSRRLRAKVEAAYSAGGGCTSGKGVFYIRDSIYSDLEGPVYRYDPSNPAADAPYAKRIVFKEYDWLRYFANHVAVVYPRTTAPGTVFQG